MDYCGYKSLAMQIFRGVSWSNPAEVASLNQTAERLTKRDLKFRKEFTDYWTEVNFGGIVLTRTQEQTIEELITELNYFKALAGHLEAKLRAAKQDPAYLRNYPNIVDPVVVH